MVAIKFYSYTQTPHVTLIWVSKNVLNVLCMFDGIHSNGRFYL